jgi:hypothetical protein
MRALLIFCAIMASFSLYGAMTQGHILWHACFVCYSGIGVLMLLLIPRKS